MSLPVILVLVQTYFLQIEKPFVNVGDKSKIQIIIEFSNEVKLFSTCFQCMSSAEVDTANSIKVLLQLFFLNNNLNIFKKIICMR
jgi:hypothetical protein